MKKIEENKKINIRLIDFKFASHIVVRKSICSVDSVKRILTVTFEKSFWHETKRAFRAKSMCTSFHQNELHLQAMIESLRRSLRDRPLTRSHFSL